MGERRPGLRRVAKVTRGAPLECTADRLAAIVREVAVPRSRLHATEGITSVRDTMLRFFKECGWAAEIQPFTYEDVAGFYDYRIPGRSKLDTTYASLSGENIIATRRTDGPEPLILVGAHYDSVRDSPGADDNASSLALLVELARILRDENADENVILVAFDLEEVGAIGSRAFVERLTRRPAMAIILESVGYYDDQPGTQLVPAPMRLLFPTVTRQMSRRGNKADSLIIIHRRDSRDVARGLAAAVDGVGQFGPTACLMDPSDIPLLGPLLGSTPQGRAFARSDHISFWKKDILSVQLTDTANYRNPRYHEPSDTPDSLDYNRMAALAYALSGYIKDSRSTY